MQKAIFIVDANNANYSSIEAIKKIRTAYDQTRLVVIGNCPQVNRWETITGEPGDVIHQPKRLRRGATLALFGFVAGDLMHDQGLADWSWWLIGGLRAIEEVAAQARARGIDAETYESFTPDEAQAALDRRGSYSQSLRELFIELKTRSGEKPVHLGSFAEEAIRHWPELRSHSLRKALFGGKKFAKIADEIGLIRERYELIGFAGSTPSPAP